METCNAYSGSPQVERAPERIRADRSIAAIYGFSGGGYNVRLIWKQLEPRIQERIRKVVVIGSPSVTKDDFPGSAEVLIMGDPPDGHMAGPKRLLESLDAERGHHNRRVGAGARHPGDSGMAGASVDHGAGAEQIQGLLAGLKTQVRGLFFNDRTFPRRREATFRIYFAGRDRSVSVFRQRIASGRTVPQ
jgi:hypothetical protein